MQQMYTQPATLERMERKNSINLLPEAFGQDQGFPLFDDLCINTQIS